MVNFLIWITLPDSHLTHLALVHVPRTLVVIGEGDEVGDHTQQAVWEELLMCGNSTKNLILKDSNVHEELEWREDKDKAQGNAGGQACTVKVSLLPRAKAEAAECVPRSVGSTGSFQTDVPLTSHFPFAAIKVLAVEPRVYVCCTRHH